MRRRNLGWLAMMGATMLALGCGGKAASTPTLVGNVPKPVVAAALDDLAYLPIDSDVVVSLDAATLRQSAMYRELVEPKLRAFVEASGSMGKFKSICGFDPFAAITSVAIGARQLATADDPQSYSGVVVLHGFERQRLMSCLETFNREVGSDNRYLVDGEVIQVQTKGGQSGYMQFVDPSTMVMVFDHQATKAAFQTIIAGASGVNGSPAFMALYGQTKGTARFFINGRLKSMENSPLKVKVVFGAISVTDALALNFSVRMNSDAEAKAIADSVRPQLESLKSMVTSGTVDAVGADAHFTASMTTEQLKNFMALVGMGG